MKDSSSTRTAVSPVVGKPTIDELYSSVDGVLPQALILVFTMVLLLVVIAVFLICFYKLRRDKKRRRNDTTAGAITSSHDGISGSPDRLFYFQPKTELDAEQIRHEMEGNGRVFELEGRDRCQEMRGEETGPDMLSLGIVHELRGEDHAKELDVSCKR